MSVIKVKQTITINEGTFKAYKKHCNKKSFKMNPLLDVIINTWVQEGKPELTDYRSMIPTLKYRMKIQIRKDLWESIEGSGNSKSELIENLILNYLNGGK